MHDGFYHAPVLPPPYGAAIDDVMNAASHSTSNNSPSDHRHRQQHYQHRRHLQCHPPPQPHSHQLALLNGDSSRRDMTARALPHALQHLDQLMHQIRQQKRRVVFFLDYDGTLSPIVDNPAQTSIPASTRAALTALSARFATAIVTGRAKHKVMRMVGLQDRVVYAASHGFDIHAPWRGDKGLVHQVALEFIPVLKRAARDLGELSGRFDGVVVEDNLLSMSLHFRHVRAQDHEALKREVDCVAAIHGLTRHEGKMVHELRPPHDWHKGKAVEYLLGALDLDGCDVVPIYCGDDVADEAAFEAVQARGGVGVIVAEESLSRGTCAQMRLKDPVEVGEFLRRFAVDETLTNTVGVRAATDEEEEEEEQKKKKKSGEATGTGTGTGTVGGADARGSNN